MDGAEGRVNLVLLFGSADLASTLCCTELEEQYSCDMSGWRAPVEVPTGVPKAWFLVQWVLSRFYREKADQRHSEQPFSTTPIVDFAVGLINWVHMKLTHIFQIKLSYRSVVQATRGWFSLAIGTPERPDFAAHFNYYGINLCMPWKTIVYYYPK